tara:strand:+ start:1031 stop:1318 length:288 start_codon:yes stop_codon:yes gene_type:complete
VDISNWWKFKQSNELRSKIINKYLYVIIMKKNCWYLYLFEDESRTEIFKIMKFDTISEMSVVLDIKPAVLSNYFHGLIKPRGVLKYCIIYQSIPL